MQNDNQPPPLQEILDALNNLNERVVAVENGSANDTAFADIGKRLDVLESRSEPVLTAVTGDVFTAADRAVISEVAAFLGVHTVVANTLATREGDPAAVINPNTGLEVTVAAQRQAVLSPSDLPGPGA